MSMACSLGDAAPSFHSHGISGMSEAWSPRVPISPGVPARAGGLTVRPRFENMALLAGKAPPKARDLLDVLLASALPVHDRGCQVLRTMWVEEAMHRAYAFVRLVDARNRRGRSTSATSDLEGTIACDLLVRFRELATGREREVLPCSAILRDVVVGLGMLFGYPADIALKSKIQEVSLPAYKRRALVLAASELVSNALLHAFQGRKGGLIDVRLSASDPKSACLHVADNGIGFADASPNLDCGLGAGLAGLLEANLAYNRMASWTIAEIVFPVSEC